MNFTPVGWIDVYDLACSLRPRLSQFQGTGTRVLPLRGPRKDTSPDDEYGYVDSRLLAKWVEVRAAVDRIRDAAAMWARSGNTGGGGAVEFGRIFLDMLDGGGAINPLRRDNRAYWSRHVRLLVGIRCPPHAYLWAPPEQLVIQPGQVVMTSPALWHAAINLSETPRVNLVVDVKKASTPSPPQTREPAASGDQPSDERPHPRDKTDSPAWKAV